MARVSLALFKEHVRSDEFASDDTLLQYYLDAATQAVYNAIGYTEEELSVIPDDYFPKPLCQAIMLRGASMYAYREDVDSATYGTLPLSLQALIKPYAKLSGGGLMEPLLEQYAGEGSDE